MNARFWASLSCRAASACPAGLLDFEAIQRKGQRVADPLQEIQFRFGERARRVDVEIQGAEHRAVQAEGYGGERWKEKSASLLAATWFRRMAWPMGPWLKALAGLTLTWIDCR